MSLQTGPVTFRQAQGLKFITHFAATVFISNFIVSMSIMGCSGGKLSPDQPIIAIRNNRIWNEHRICEVGYGRQRFNIHVAVFCAVLAACAKWKRQSAMLKTGGKNTTISAFQLVIHNCCKQKETQILLL